MRYQHILVVVVFLLICSSFSSAGQVVAAHIVLDAGHGGADPGAIGVNGLREKDVNLDVTLKLRDELEERGYSVSLTRETDRALSLQERVAFKEAQQADLFVSIHANAYHHPSASGSLVLYYDRKYPRARYPASPEMAQLSDINKQFAQYVLEGLVQEANTINMGIVPSSVYVVRRGTMPSILVELAFLSNWYDAERLADDYDRSLMARGIANGIEAFWPLQHGLFRDIAGHWAAESIIKLNEQGIVQGFGDRFQPDHYLTRAEFLAMMDRIFHFSAQEMPSTYFLKDIQTNHWAYPIVEKAVELGIIQGYPDGTLRPDAPISRAEVSVLFDRIWDAYDSEDDQAEQKSEGEKEGDEVEIEHEDAHESELELESELDEAVKEAEVEIHADPTYSFIDVPHDIWYAQSVYRLKKMALIQGVTATSFAPERAMTRAEMAAVIDRFLAMAPERNESSLF